MGPANTGVLHCRRLMFNLSRFVRKGKCKVMVNQQKAPFLEDVKRTLHFDSSYNPIQGCRAPHTLSRAQTLFVAVMPALRPKQEGWGLPQASASCAGCPSLNLSHLQKCLRLRKPFCLPSAALVIFFNPLYPTTYSISTD